jgi:hypothetical protein
VDVRVGRVLELLEHELGPEGLEELPTLPAHGLGHGEHDLVALARRGEGEADPVSPLVGSRNTMSSFTFPAYSAASIMATPMRSFTNRAY